ncbi:MAG: hypothetical protein LBN27_13720 [Prevotellaceae bacterium]|jgi:hypothetical protein|nr:hypothetical protein [Prevotellaceae bacterium]
MIKTIQLTVINLCLLSTIVACTYERNNNSTEYIVVETQETESNIPKVKNFEYDLMTIPQFFTAVIANHLSDFYKIDSAAYNEFCEEENLMPRDTNNINHYFTLKILHDLFTCSSASNGSRGEILDIPYFWHWVTPNPRYEIYFTATGQLLNRTRPPQEFSKYGSFADIDRTPYLFLSDLLTENPQYYSVSCDTFSTFGWCSEREMAFSALVKLLNYDSKVVASGNHSWSEVILKMRDKNGNLKNYKVHIDNTFDNVSFNAITQSEIDVWKQNSGNSDIERWYNKKTISDASKIEQHIVNQTAMQRIEKKTVEYLKKSLQK